MLRAVGPTQSGAVRVVTASGNILASDYALLANAASGNMTLAFPISTSLSSGGQFQYFSISKIDSTGNTVTITKNAADSFSNGNPSMTLNVQGDSLSFRVYGDSKEIVIV